MTSPWYRGGANTEKEISVDSSLWVQAVYHFRLVGGENDWARLGHVAQDSAAIQKWQLSSGVSLEETTASLQVFAEIVNALIADCRALPLEGSLGELTRAFECLIEKHLWLPTEHSAIEQDATGDERNESA